MQWLRQTQAEDPSEFWREVEARRGGPVSFYSFATLLGRSDGSRLDLPGLLYTVNETAWFEDFEKDNWLARVIAGTRKYQKTEISFGVGEVEEARVVTRGRAAQCMAVHARPEAVPRASPLALFFSVPIVEVLFRNGSAIFFDILKRKEFAALFEGGKA